MKKKIIFCVVGVVVCACICVLIFSVFYYKKQKNGNNMSNKTLEEIEDYILNINSYKAELKVEVVSNKNINKYVLEQEFVAPNLVSQKVVEPKNIENLTIKYNGKNLEIINSKLNLSTIYENYNYVANNRLWLSDFISKYKNEGGKISEIDGEIIMELKEENNISTKLYINKKENKIEKLDVCDNKRNTKIYIQYNNIEINAVNLENVVAFKKIETIHEL